MKLQKVLVAAMMATGMVLVGCNSDDDNCPADFTGELTSGEQVFVGTWELSGIEADEEIDITDDDVDNPSTDLFAQYGACDTDAVYTFANTRVFTFKQGFEGTNCANKASLEGTWMMQSNKISFSYSCALATLDIDVASDNASFTVTTDQRIRNVDNQYVDLEVTYTYTKR